MTLNNLLNKNSIELSKKYYDLCLEGINIMKKAVDKHHDEKHIYSLFDKLDNFLEHEKHVELGSLDFEVLLPGICWHDVWKSKRDQTNKILTLIYEQLYEGFGSLIIFYENTKDKDYKKRRAIGELIAFHPGYEFFPGLFNIFHKLNKSLELLILNDLDRLDSLEVKRLKDYAKRYIKKGSTDPKLFRLAYFWVKNVTVKRKGDSFHFGHTKEMFMINKEKVIKEAVKMFKDLVGDKEYYFDLTRPDARFIIDFEFSRSDLELIELYTK